MTDPKKTEDTKKPASTTDQPKKDEGTVKAPASGTTSEPVKSAEPAKTEAPKTADGGANIQTKHENIQTEQLAGVKVPHKDPENFSTKPEEEETPPETISDEELKAQIGEVAFASDTNQGKDPTEAQRNPQDPVVPVKGSLAAAQGSIERLKSIVYAYPKDASNGTVVFGYGGISITIGDLRAVVAVL